ncbi:MAG TPA: hypothetical protein VN461_21015 [Vicinamibacteria bacterium]|jgi:type II secretory pathway pseudopilin PulG|nr:hypothetical protein [Vicinamibacteria bacterium]
MTKTEPRAVVATGDRGGEAGFTLVEALTAIVILIFGLMAVTNLLLVAASSNSVASQSTAATLSASQRLEFLKTTSFQNLTAGGSLTADITFPANPCPVAPLTDYDCDDVIPGVGLIHTRWQISAVPGTARLLYIGIRSEGTGALSGARSRAQFTSFRSCTDSSPTGGCPAPP